MNICKINPYIRRAMDNTLDVNITIARRIIYDYELLYIADGLLLLEYDGQNHICKKGDLLLLRPGVPHAFVKILEPLRQPHVHFDVTYEPDSETVPVCFKNLDALTDAERAMIREDVFAEYPAAPFLRISDPEAFRTLFFEVVLPKCNDVLATKAKFLELLSIVIADNFSGCFTRPSGIRIEEQVKDFIDAGQGLTFTLDDFEQQFAYDKYYLEKRFRAAYNDSIMSYRNAKRMEIAAQMLAEESVSSVATHLGFGSIYSFSRAYKNHFGVAPSRYK